MNSQHDLSRSEPAAEPTQAAEPSIPAGTDASRTETTAGGTTPRNAAGGRALVAYRGESRHGFAGPRPGAEPTASRDARRQDVGSAPESVGRDDAAPRLAPNRTSRRTRRAFLHAVGILCATMVGWTGGILGYPRGTEGSIGAPEHIGRPAHSADAGAPAEPRDWKAEIAAAQRETTAKLDGLLDALGRIAPAGSDAAAKLDALSAKLDRIERPPAPADAALPAAAPASLREPDAPATVSDESIRQFRDEVQSSQRDLTTRLDQVLERLDQVERAGRAPAAKLDRIAQRLDRVERQATSATRPGKMPPSTIPPKTATLEGWTVRDVHDGVAVVEGPRGVVEVEEGASLPGVGRVKAIARQAGRWIVQTSRGVIAAIEP